MNDPGRDDVAAETDDVREQQLDDMQGGSGDASSMSARRLADSAADGD